MRRWTIDDPLEPDPVYAPGQELSFNLVLVGRANDYLPYFVYAFEELGKMGIGKGRGRYRLTAISDLDGSVYDCRTRTLRPGETVALPVLADNGETGKDGEREVSITFLTPARIVYGRRLVSDLEFKVLVTSLLRRLLLLGHFHCNQNGGGWDHKAMIGRAEKVEKVQDSLSWRDWERYSGRQKTRMKMGGLVGTVTYRGEIEPFLSLLRAGEVLHVGKGTAFGLGKYRLHDDKG